MSFSEFLESIPRERGDDIFLIDPKTRTEISYRETHELALRVACEIQDRWCGVQERIAVAAENSIELAQFFIASLYARTVVVPINHNQALPEIEYVLGHARPRTFVLSRKVLASFGREALAPLVGNIVVLEDLIAENRAKAVIVPPSRVSYAGAHGQDEMVQIYTSGTTSRPKGVVHRVDELWIISELFGERVEMDERTRICNVLPMTNMVGYHNNLLKPFFLGSSVVVADAFSPLSVPVFWKAIEENQVNALWLVPSILAILLQLDRDARGKNYCRSSIRKIFCGTAPLPPVLRHRFEAEYSAPVYESYGLTETLFLCTNHPRSPVIDGCAGEIIPGVEARTVDEAGNVLTEGDTGEIQARTPAMLRRYAGVEKEYARDEWFPTGDIGVIREGRIYVTDRKKDLIIRGGNNVSPASIEAEIMAHPEVVACAVVGRPHAIAGEEIIAVVKIASARRFEEIRDEIAMLCRKRMAPVKQPSHILRIEDFARTAGGKIKKTEVRTWLASQLPPPL